jgi:DNA invertase Pin-like site-specific DNA recombinase
MAAKEYTPSIFGYTRTSTDRQDLSPEVQRAEILKKYREIGGWYHDTASGGAGLDKRPALAELLAVIKKGDTLLISRRDRLCRDVYLASWLEKESLRKGFKIESADGVGNGDDPNAELMRHIVSAFASFERAMIRLRTKAALDAKRRRGEKLGGSLPFGYRLGRPRRVKIDGGEKKQIKILEPMPEEQVVIKKIIGWHRKGLGLRPIARRLNDAGIPGPQKGSWNAVTVGAILRREGARS